MAQKQLSQHHISYNISYHIIIIISGQIHFLLGVLCVWINVYHLHVAATSGKDKESRVVRTISYIYIHTLISRNEVTLISRIYTYRAP